MYNKSTWKFFLIKNNELFFLLNKKYFFLLLEQFLKGSEKKLEWNPTVINFAFP